MYNNGIYIKDYVEDIRNLRGYDRALTRIFEVVNSINSITYNRWRIVGCCRKYLQGFIMSDIASGYSRDISNKVLKEFRDVVELGK